MGFEAMITTWLFGLVSGLRHAVEPDHVAAVSALAADGHGTRRTARLGAWWGLGHTTALFGAALILGRLRTALPASIEAALELGVALMLIGLGVRAIRHAVGAARGGVEQWHLHRGHPHRHSTAAPHVHVGRWALSPGPFLVGIVHGLAGSGALVALATVQFPSESTRLIYVLLFGLGSMVAMAALSGLVGWQLARAAARPHAHDRLQAAAGVLSLVVGVAWAYPMIARWFH